ncbi:HpcH/HpaI aldolase/citrate lyase family protein [Aneurinibacillus terranovensis]|uniref:HpcH/HpaI aldolase/citrate lyase family protein n=1 Tax=Aneurinibacillus terranovensis TaxID=278991 RepID=UPI000402AE24|nr:HpcH/HpaI aldolase/citrate lyase family protein [Aneurinibacillus terranovensis]
MKYFSYLSRTELQEVFFSCPGLFNRNSEKEILTYAVGALLYMPATRAKNMFDIISRKYEEALSIGLCLEDAIGDGEVIEAERILLSQFEQLTRAIVKGKIQQQDIPLLFIRVRSPEQMTSLASRMGPSALSLVTGFLFPKFSRENGAAYLAALEKMNVASLFPIYGMPILETPDVMYKETRLAALLHLKQLLDSSKDFILNVRIGATDFSGLYGLRRSNEMTVYDIAVIRDCIADIVNVFAREGGYTVSGPVWEYFTRGSEGLIREIMLDKANGLIGKTVIHPSQLAPVQACYVVSHEEYSDARSIMDGYNSGCGVTKSPYENKMNEMKPHIHWAKKVLLRSKVYGVFHEGKNYSSLLAGKVYVSH